ncbi:MAG: hypothetical protein N2C14_04830, partial [Planctomycetales bacterium]
MTTRVSSCAAAVLALLATWGSRAAGQHEQPEPAGYHLLRTKAYLPPDFSRELFDDLWKSWPEPLRSEAEKASPKRRRQMAFSKYGLMEDPDRPNGPALGYADNGQGGWSMTCLACHGGKVAGRVVPGVPNSHYALQTLTEDVAAAKSKAG